MNLDEISIPEKLVTNYKVLDAFFAKAPPEQFPRQEKVKKIEGNTTVIETEDIMTAGVKRKWKTREEFQKEWKSLPW